MRDYGKVSPQFWTGTTGRRIRALGVNAQVVALYLMTCPSSSMIGLYYLPLPVLAHETGIPLEGACKALRSLSEVGFAEYDDTNEIVLVHAMARHQIGERVVRADKRHLGVTREAQKLTYSSLFAKWYARYQEPYDLPPMASTASPLEGPSKPLRSQEQEHGQENDTSAVDDAKPSPPAAPSRSQDAEAPDPSSAAGRAVVALEATVVLRGIVKRPHSMCVSAVAAFPAIDVAREIAAAEAWLIANPKNTKKDGDRYLNGWLSRAQERAPRVDGGGPRGFAPPVATREQIAERLPIHQNKILKGLFS